MGQELTMHEDNKRVLQDWVFNGIAGEGTRRVAAARTRETDGDTNLSHDDNTKISPRIGKIRQPA